MDSGYLSGSWQSTYGTDNFVARYKDDAWDIVGPLAYGPRTYHGAFLIDGTIFKEIYVYGIRMIHVVLSKYLTKIQQC